MQRLAALGPSGHHESDGSGKERQELHEVANGGLAERQLATGGGEDLKPQDALAQSGMPAGALRKSAVQP